MVKGSEVWMNDVYVPNGEKHRDLRLRQMGDKFMVTRKRLVRDGDATVMIETTIELSREEFAALSAGIETNVEKERCLVDVAEWRGELNVFRGRHEGLVTVEFEFQNEADLADFEEKADYLESIKNDIDAGRKGAAQGKIKDLMTGIQRANYYISAQDFQTLSEYNDMVK